MNNVLYFLIECLEIVIRLIFIATCINIYFLMYPIISRLAIVCGNIKTAKQNHKKMVMCLTLEHCLAGSWDANNHVNTITTCNPLSACLIILSDQTGTVRITETDEIDTVETIVEIHMTVVDVTEARVDVIEAGVEIRAEIDTIVAGKQSNSSAC